MVSVVPSWHESVFEMLYKLLLAQSVPPELGFRILQKSPRIGENLEYEGFVLKLPNPRCARLPTLLS